MCLGFIKTLSDLIIIITAIIVIAVYLGLQSGIVIFSVDHSGICGCISYDAIRELAYPWIPPILRPTV